MEDSNATRKTFVVPDIKPLDLYDSTRGKICASVGWLLAKSYGNAEKVPVELREPFYCDQYEQEHLKPPVTRLLLSSELYCRTYTLLVGGSAPEGAPPPDNAALLQLLADRGLPPTDLDAPVGDADLRRKPIKMSAHLALMDALMAVGAMETVATAKTRGAAGLLGGGTSWQEPLLHWVNELNQKLRQMEEGTQDDPAQTNPEPESVQPSLRYRKDKTQSRQKPIFPIVNEVKDLSTGCAVVAVMHYYCPDLLRLEDVCMKDAMSAADSLSNLHFIREFCESCLKSCCSLALEDMLYAPPELQSNWLSFLAELLNWFEVRRPEFVQPRDSSDGSRPAVPASSSKSGSPSIFRRPFVPISSHLSQSGPLTQSTSLSHLENAGKTKIRKPLSRPLSAVSFSIPFGLDSDVDVVMGDPLITRSVSSDQLTPGGPAKARAPFAPPGDLAHLLPRANGPQRASWVTQNPNAPRLAENGHQRESEAGELPTIEEALQIIHNESKMEPRHHPDGAPDGFYLHSPDDQAGGRHAGGPPPGPVSCSAPSRSGTMYRPPAEPREPGRTRNPSEGSRDDDSVLRDGSVDSDASEDPPKTPAAATTPWRPHGKEASDSGVKMTSFAERKKRHGPESPKAGEPPAGAPAGGGDDAAARAVEEGPGKSPKLTNEMSELGVRLEEKRKAIEAQKKRIEAIFAKHRQRLGKSAFLQLKKEQDEGEGGAENGQGPPAAADGDLTLEERLARMEQEEKGHDERRPSKDEAGAGDRAGAQADKKAAPSGEKATAPLGDYNNAVSKLTMALSSLQSDMQRLSDQQSQLIRKKPAAPGARSWVIPPGPKPPTPGRSSREPSRDLNSASSSPSPSPSRRAPGQTPPPKSPYAHRRAQSAPPKSPKHQQARPPDPKGPGVSRVLTAPRNVDRIPHLRRVDPWQCKVQTSSSFTIGSDDRPADLYPSPDPTPTHTPDPTPAPTPTPTPPRLPAEDALSEAGSNDNQSIFSMELDTPRKERPAVGGSSSGAPSECSFESDAVFNGDKRGGGGGGGLVEVSLLAARGGGGEGGEDDEEQGPDPFSDSVSDVTEPELRSGLGFFFKDDKERPEDEMAQRRAALLEKQQKRADDMKKRKLELEKEKEANRPQWMTIEGWGDKGDSRPSTPGTPTGSSTPTAEGTPQRRGDFTRLEYERRHQLKVMEDLGKVLRQKPTTVRGVKNRPKTVFRDDSGLSRSPAKGFDTRLNKQYSHSTMNLSSVANDLSVRKSPSRSHSPARRSSPGRVSSQNGDRDWENGSTISSPASIPEYTGPKLYKEPSFKSNKFIIHNAISRCCLAGKVNEPQKNKIVEEMEKSPANHFLILFRDASCQFRAVYTMNPETEEMVRLTGVGPRVIGPDMVESIFKYSSDRKQFTAIPSKTMSMSVDAFTIPAQLWQKRPGTPKKLGTPK
ncbi:calmodulin-regulated spectrin-associated protein 3 isoform X2 [Gadus morhua]|uniref:Calmodulin regulated spectrin-associated protein family, member 3 n=1 Tax=Gadus morhua TaxID=8049 RepID=A0A8C4ZBW0_GADMO|nr:calmodulin-regulated spectrin-associated protein 3 isoform X2 [Gadus morhua]